METSLSDNKVTVKFDVFPFGLRDSASSTSHEVLVDGLEPSQIICLLCTKVVTAPSNLSPSLRELKETITEIAIIDSAYLHSTEDHLGFCESCEQKIERLRELYSKFLQWRDDLVTISTEITYLILQTNTRFLWGESAENLIDESFYHEWNLQRIQQMLQSKLQVVNITETQVNPPAELVDDDEEQNTDKEAELNSGSLELAQVTNIEDSEEDFTSRPIIHVIHSSTPEEEQIDDDPNIVETTVPTSSENQPPASQPQLTTNNDGQPIFRCESCNKVFSRGYSLRLHIRTHTGEQSLVCDKCNKKFTSHTTLKAHQKVHMEKKMMTCPICGKVMGQKRAFEAHLHRHHMKDYLVSGVTCDICQKSFASPLQLMTHMNVHRGEFQCSVINCRKAFNTCHSLTEHEKIHQSDVQMYDCDFCSNVFDNENLLNKHVSTHMTLTSFLCDHCGKCFPSRSLLQAHLRVHKNIEYKCKVCDKNFCSASNLKSHQRLHTGERPFQCPNCNLSFAQKASLNLHMRKHSGVNPFLCSYCETTGFTYKLAFRQHLATKHPEIYLETKKFLCKVCWKNFNSETDLMEHEVTHEKHKCKENKLALTPLKKSGKDPELSRLLTKIQLNNEQQWKHVRQFVRNILKVELEQEKWTRKSAEDLNARLSKQNNYLRSKLQEKRNERVKLNEELQEIKNKYRAQSKAISQSQQSVATRCQETFEKLTKLYMELETIQKQMMKDLEKAPTASSNGESSKSSNSSPHQEISKVKIKIRKRVPKSPELLSSTTNYEALTYPHQIPTEGDEPQYYLDEAAKLKVLSEYYPLMLESRTVIENLLSRIGTRISHLIELASYHQNLERSRKNNSGDSRAKTSTSIEKRDDHFQNDNLLVLFSNDYDKLMTSL